MSLTSIALQQKKANRKKEEQLRQAALQKAKLSLTAEARLSTLLDNIGKMFEDPAVKELTFEIEEISVSIVSKAIYEGKFAEYNTVLNGNQLIVSPQMIAL